MDINELTSREIPHSIEAERTVLGAVLIDMDCISDVLPYVNPNSFYMKKHSELFSVILSLFTLGTDADIVTVLDRAVQEGIFEDERTGKEYLAALMTGVPSRSNLITYCKIVEEKYNLRSLIHAAENIIRNCTESSDPADILLDSAEQMIYDIRQGRDVSGLSRVDDVLYDAYDELSHIAGPDKEKYQGIKSGYAMLDDMIYGLKKSNLIILAARPGMGKTSFALNVAANVCRTSPDKEVVFFSLEMSKEQLVTKLLSSESLVDSKHLNDGFITPNDWEKLAQGANRISRMNMYLDDTASATVMQMKSKLRRLKNVGLVVIDYLQLMSSGKNIENRVNEISDITRQLKLMAKELDVPVITLSQLSRSVESRPDKRPLLSDLRESGSIEQDADIVLFLYREGYYAQNKVEDANLAECIVAKNRHGRGGTINLRWNGQYTLFLSEDRYQQQ